METTIKKNCIKSLSSIHCVSSSFAPALFFKRYPTSYFVSRTSMCLISETNLMFRGVQDALQLTYLLFFGTSGIEIARTSRTATVSCSSNCYNTHRQIVSIHETHIIEVHTICTIESDLEQTGRWNSTRTFTLHLPTTISRHTTAKAATTEDTISAAPEPSSPSLGCNFCTGFTTPELESTAIRQDGNSSIGLRTYPYCEIAGVDEGEPGCRSCLDHCKSQGIGNTRWLAWWSPSGSFTRDCLGMVSLVPISECITMSLYPEKQSQQKSSKKCRKTYNRNSGSSIGDQLLLLPSTSRLTRTTSTRVFPWREKSTNTRRRWWRGAAPQHNNHLRLYLNSALLIWSATPTTSNNKTTSRRWQWLLHMYRNQRSQEGSTRAEAVRCYAAC